MRTPRLALLLALCVLALGRPLILPPAARAVGTWVPAAPPAALGADDRGGVGTLVPLPDGRILAFGTRAARPGEQARLVAAIYDPATDRWTQQSSSGMPENGNATPTLLPGGRVLLVGGGYNPGSSPGGGRVLAAAQLYDPATGAWTPAAPLATPRSGHTATLLRDGTVLVVGGSTRTSYQGGGTTRAAERYDPGTGRWSAAGQLATGREGHTATLLADGRVLVVGGRPDILASGAPAELYDPATNGWVATGPMVAPRGGEHRATLLPDGSVLVTGGYTSRPDANSAVVPQAAAERYDPAADRWVAAAPMSSPRNAHSATLLPDGTVLVAGGYTSFPSSAPSPPPLASTERYDPLRDAWIADAPLTTPRTGHGAAPLPDGRVFVAGGTDEPSAERYTPDPTTYACFAETGQCVTGRFLAYWREHGGLARNGFPLSPVHKEVLEDGQSYQVQYFERVRMEYHPENAPPYDVLLGQFGRRVLRETEGLAPSVGAPTAPRPGQAFFPETGHTVAPDFLAYWEANGGLAQFGYPLAEEFAQQLEDGQTYTVQYFERARFERHPENQPPYDILLGQFGRRILSENDWLAGQPGLRRLDITDERLQALLGSPGSPYYPIARPRSYQSFERGALLYWGEAVPPSIIVLCGGTPQAGDTVRVYPDTWREGEAGGGGAGPRPGLYEPARGFGTLWRENPAVRDCLGYATDPAETGHVGQDHPFARGETRLAVTPTGRFIYALYGATASQPCYVNPTPACRYERYPDPNP